MRNLRTRAVTCLLTTLICGILGQGTAEAGMLLDTPTTIEASSAYNATYAVTKLIDGAITDADIGTANNLGDQYAGSGVGPHVVYMGFTSAITTDSFVYSQRAGANPAVDKVTQIEFWFESSDPGAGSRTTVPVGLADEIVTIMNTTDNILTQEMFGGGSQSLQYVVMRLTGNGGNPGGSEFRFTDSTLAPPPPATTNIVIPLTVDGAGTTAPGHGTSIAGLLSDAFAYNPDDPTSTSPHQLWGPTSEIYITPGTGGGIVDLDFDAVYDNIMLDIWGRSDYSGAEETRTQDLTITFYNGAVQTHQVVGWDGVSVKPESYGRYTPPADVLADRVTIGHTSDYLLITEVRAATIPEPATITMVALGALLGLRRKRR